jgi:7-keto-8-aminopelargonate synthetase-like enzyme
VVLQLPKESVFEADITSGIMQECLQRGIAVVATGQDASSHLRTELAPAIRMTVSTLHTKDDMDKAIDALVESANIVTARYPLEEQE